MSATWIDELVPPTFRVPDENRDVERSRWQRAVLRTFERSLPSLYRDARFDNPLLEQRVTLPIPSELPSARSIVFVGPPGIGKTTLAVAMLRARLEQELVDSSPMGDDGIIRSAAQFRFAHAHRIAVARINGADGLVELTGATHARVLLIDDLGGGATVASSPVRDVVQERHADERETWFTTNLDARAIAERYGVGIARRIFEHASIVRPKMR